MCRHSVPHTSAQRASRALLSVLALLTACAIPQTHKGFSITSPSNDGAQVEYASTEDLMVSGLVSEALGYAQTSRFVDAEVRLRQARYLKPANEAVAFNTAVVISQTGQTEEAEEIVNDLLSRHPSNPNYRQALADIHVAEGRYAQAIEELKKVFQLYKTSGNYYTASRIARSISNIVFGIGKEQEALCYSAEAVSLYPAPAQSGAHLRILVALNFFKQAEEYQKSLTAEMNSVVGYHYLAMARYALGNFTGAAEAEDIAYARTLEAPERSGEISVAWWLMKNKIPPLTEETDEAKERFAEMRKEVADFAQKDNFELSTWPNSLREELYSIKPEEES